MLGGFVVEQVGELGKCGKVGKSGAKDRDCGDVVFHGKVPSRWAMTQPPRDVIGGATGTVQETMKKMSQRCTEFPDMVQNLRFTV
jgi:hypothetical protein